MAETMTPAQMIEYILAKNNTEKIQYKSDKSAEQIAGWLFDRYELECALRGKLVQNKTEVGKLCVKVGKWLNEENKKCWLLILGGMGTGKTTMLNCIGRCVNIIGRTKGFGGMYASALDIPRHASSENDEDYLRMMNGLDRAEYLLLDDIGIEPVEVKSYGNSLIPFVEIVNKRYAKQLPIIITSNLTLEDIRKRYGDRVFDRMREMADIINFKGNSYR